MGNGEIGRAFHEVTKHTTESISGGGRRMTLENMPNAFKTYEVPLERRTPSGSIARILTLGAGVLRKATYSGRTIHFRTYASAGALYPVELYLVDANGTSHFDPLTKELVRLRTGDHRCVIGEGALTYFVATGIPWRTGWKYGDRGYRHLFWDTGTILANVLELAVGERLSVRVVTGFDDVAISRLVDVDGVTEFPLCVVALDEAEVSGSDDVEPLGLPVAPLSPDPERFPALEEVHAAGCLDASAVEAWRGASRRVAAPVPLSAAVEQVIRKRGSARRFGPGSVPRSSLEGIVRYAMQGLASDHSSGVIRVFAAVHAVDGLPPGTYRWEDEAFVPQLQRDVRTDSTHLCLGQNLGGDGAVTLYLMADLNAVLDRYGDRGYRIAQLEGGLVLGRLDLAAHAQGSGATGLTFFDDEVTSFFGPAAAGLECMVVCAIGERQGRRLPLA